MLQNFANYDHKDYPGNFPCLKIEKGKLPKNNNKIADVISEDGP